MKVYVAGPMTGYPDWNFPAFADAAERLRAEGFDVQSPHEFDLEDGFDPSSHGEDFDLRAALERDVEAVLDADGVVLLDGWEESPGVAIEVLTAESQGKPAKRLREWLAAGVAALAAFVGVGLASPAIAESDGAETRIAATRAERVEKIEKTRERLEKVREERQTPKVKKVERRLERRLNALV